MEILVYFFAVIAMLIHHYIDWSGRKGNKMKIKHFAGYGSIEAKKISKVTTNNTTILTVLVTGDHEQGLIPVYIIPGLTTLYSDYTIKKVVDRSVRQKGKGYRCIALWDESGIYKL